MRNLSIQAHLFVFKLTYLVLLIGCFGFGILNAQTSFDIQAFSDSTKYGWQNYLDRATYREDITNRQNLLQLYELEALPLRTNLIKSAVIPGWGQFSTKNNSKATIILSIELVTLLGSLYFYDQAMVNYNQYKTATQIDEINRYYSKAQTPYQYAIMLLGLATVVWGYNVFDVVISTNEYNANLWQDIMERQKSSPLQITPSGLEWRF
ncbi:MAG TPA: hypothetical protein PL188_09090 [Candidatus Cloacimonadota bacterium]|jgi:hypothetical protein|nr:hypothetical protein [Candidatus Cloacimonadota bacterium]